MYPLPKIKKIEVRRSCRPVGWASTSNPLSTENEVHVLPDNTETHLCMFRVYSLRTACPYTRVPFDLFLVLIFGERYSWLLIAVQIFSTPLTLLLGPSTLLSILLSHIPQLSSYLNVRDSVSQPYSREGLAWRLAAVVQFPLHLRPAFHLITTVSWLA